MHPLFSSDLPRIMPGDPAPGQARWRSGRLSWTGSPAWIVLHGDGESLWIGGLMAAARDGGRGEPRQYLPGMPETGQWRRAEAKGEWTHGKLSTGDRLGFQPADGQLGWPEWSAGSLPADIVESAAMRAFSADAECASDLYAALCSAAWVHPASGREYIGDWIRAAYVAARARGRGDVPQDYFLYGGEGEVSEEVAEAMQSIGWVPAGPLPDAGPALPRAVRILETAEARPPSAPPAWYAKWATALLAEPEGFAGRAHAAAFGGRMSFREWCAFWEHFSHEDA